jgi:hypothetical protein
LPYQLPACVQFLYADLSQQQLDRMARRVVPGSAYIPAALQTAHYSHYLAPRVEISTYLSRNLRLRIPQELIRWLPSADNEPAVSPLASGAGQIPTVGRAALFSAVADDGLGPAVRDLNLAIGRLARSGEDLCRLGGTIVRSVIVLVAFSVVGGTGAGIFYDYLHLIGHTFGETRLRARIYPLVLMPSAFPEGLGGGRYANLNAAPALRDLFRLIDEQNAPQFEWNLRLSEPDADDLVVRYPGEGWVRMRPGMAQTGILFTQPPGTDRNDLYRSICSLMVALIGVGSEADPGDSATGDPGEPSDDWVNAGSFRRHPADDGIGNRGVSTALVAALKSPSAEIADIISDRLLREAVRQLSSPDAATESDQEYAEAFLAAAGPADDIVPFDEPEPAQGAREVAAALRARSQAMLDGLRTLRSGDYGKVPDPGAAVDGMLAKLDVFRVHRVMVSGADLEGAADRAGADGPRRDQMIVPADLSAIPPKVPEFTDRSSRRKLRWSDPEPTAIRQRQDAWYQ